MKETDVPTEIVDVKKLWPERLARLLRVRARIDVTGMTRPSRDPVKRKFLEETGQEGPFVERRRQEDRSE